MQILADSLMHRHMKIPIAYVYRYRPLLTSDGWSDGPLRLHLEVWYHHVAVESGQVDYRSQISCLLGYQKQPTVESQDFTLVTHSMAPCISKASTACWRFCRLFLVQKLMLWWVSWGRCWNAIPTPSSTMPVARQLPSRLRQGRAKPARRAPTWDPSTLSGWGRRRSLARLLASLEGSWTSPSGASSKGRLLCHSPLRRGGRGPQAVKNWRSRSHLLGWRHFRAGLGFSLLLGESHRWASHPVGLPDGTDTILKDLWFGTHHMVSFKRCRPPEERTWGWKLKFFRRASRRSNCRFDPAAKPAETAETCASWIMASFSRRSFVRSSLGESSSITDATIESAREA